MVESILSAQVNLVLAGSDQEIEEALADKGYPKAETLAERNQWSTRTYIPGPKRNKSRRKGKPAS